jgi:hypothetical protein
VTSARIALGLIGLLTLVRLFFASRLGLFQDEAYYWQWSRHLDFSYVDQGPGIAYFIRLGTLIFGDTPIGIRFSSVLLTVGASYLAFLTARAWFCERAGLWTVILLGVAPLLSAGGLLATYDIPQAFFWAAALYALTLALKTEKVSWWFALGVLTMLGVVCKITMLALAPGVLCVLIAAPEFRKWLRTPFPYAAFVIALLGFVPIVVWNLQHDMIGLKHAQGLGTNVRGTLLGRLFGDFLGGQALAVGPAIWIAELVALFRLVRLNDKSPREFFVSGITLPFLAICLFAAAKNKLEVNWPAAMHLTGLMAVAAWFSDLWETGKKSARFAVGASVGISALLTTVGKTGVKLCENYGWDEVAKVVQFAREQESKRGVKVFVAGTDYKTNSELAFYLPDRPQVAGLYLGTRRDQYFLWTKPSELLGQTAILCLRPDQEDAVELARRYFRNVYAVAPVRVFRPGFRGAVKQFDIYRCEGFLGYDPNAHATGY